MNLRTRPALDLPTLLGMFLFAQAGDSPLAYGNLKQRLRAAVEKDPMDAVLATVIGGSFLFYLAERGINPKVKSPWDALVFVSTCLSVGYADTFARTPAGKAIATAVMTFGPALSSKILDAPGAGSEAPPLTPEMLRIQGIIADKLDAILVEMKRNRVA